MLYEYFCTSCKIEREVSKPLTEYDTPENCIKCSKPMKKLFSFRIGLHNTHVQSPYFSHSLGEVVKGDIDERQKAKQRGMVEIGNEKPRKHLKPRRQEYEW